MSADPNQSNTQLKDLYDDNQKTSAIGYPCQVGVTGATQGGKMDGTITAVAVLSTEFRPGAVMDARDLAFASVQGLPEWRKNDATGVHAEVLIIRAWIVQLVAGGMSVADAVSALRGRTIEASQPACWCCYKLMEDWGIILKDRTIGRKPSTAWRHPLAKHSIPNSDLPGSRDEVTTEWMGKASAFGN